MIGIVGNGRDKFTEKGYEEATNIVNGIIYNEHYRDDKVCSGNSPMLGIDYLVKTLTPKDRYLEYNPKNLQWNNGYRERNLKIAESRIVFVIVADKYPNEYKGRKFDSCYHCLSMNRDAINHVKSGACWTAKQAIIRGNKSEWFIVKNYDSNNVL